MAKSVQVVEKPNLPASKPSLFENDRSGLENITAADVIIPRMNILQKLSPQLDRSTPEYIEGAEEGDFCNTATGEIYKGQIEVIDCFYARVFLEWAPRNSGRKDFRNHGTDASILQQAKPMGEKRRMTLPNGNVIVETATHYCLLVTSGGKRIFIPLSSTQLKHSRRWVSLITGERLPSADGSEFQPPLYYRSWIAKPVDERNNDGAWKSWKFFPGRPIDEIDPTLKLLQEAKTFYKDASAGLVRGDVTEEDAEHSAEGQRQDSGAAL